MIKYRRAGSLESFFAWAGGQGAFGIVCRVGLHGTIDQDLLIRSIETAVQRDPFLSATLKHPETWLTAIALGSNAPQISLLARKSPHHWQEVVELELNRGPQETQAAGLRPNVHAIIMHGTHHHDLILCVDHALCDGRSLIGFIHAIVSIYNQHGQNTHRSSAENGKSLTPPLESLVPLRPRADSFLRLLSKKTVIRASKGPANSWSLLKCEDATDQNRIVFDTLSVEETAVITANARAMGLTLTELLAVRLAELRQALGAGTAAFELQLNVDLRQALGFENLFQSGVYSFWDNLSLQVDDEPLPMVRHWMRNLKGDAGTQACLPPLGFRWIAVPLLTLCDRLIGPIATSDLSLSNLGKLTFPDSCAGIKINALHFAASQRRFGSLLQITAATVENCLCLACVTRNGVSDMNGSFVLSELMERLMQQPQCADSALVGEPSH